MQPPTESDLVALTRASMEATNQREFEAATSMFAAEVVFDMTAAGLGTFEGAGAARRYLEDWIGLYEQQHFAHWDGEHLGNGIVFVDALLDARPAGAAASVRERWAFTVRWEDGMIAAITATHDVAAARAAAARAASAVR